MARKADVHAFDANLELLPGFGKHHLLGTLVVISRAMDK
jgi:hypothetical protein